MASEEIVRYRIDLEKGLEKEDKEQVLFALNQLSSANITVQLLQSTKVGVVVGKLRKHEDSKVAELAKSLIESWKKLVSTKDATPDNKVAKKKTPAENNNGKKEDAPEPAEERKPVVKEEKKKTTPTRPPPASPSSSSSTDPRAKTRELLAQVLAAPLDPEHQLTQSLDPNDVAASIEEELFRLFKSVNKDYKAKYLSLRFNLSDPKNPTLKQMVLSGEVDAERLCKMSSKEMASKELQDERRKYEEYHLQAAQSHVPDGATCDMFKCAKCGQRKTTYYQLQTRSADEPMTTFVTCVNCKNRWKMN